MKYSQYSADETGFGIVEPALLGDPLNRVRIFYPFQDFERWVVGYQGLGFASGTADIVEIKAYGSNNERQLGFEVDAIDDFPGPINFAIDIDTLNFTDLESTGLRAELTKAVGDNSVLTYGVEWAENDSFNTDNSRTAGLLVAEFPIPGFPITLFDSTDTVPDTPNGENTSYGAFVQDETTVGDNLKLSFGVRYNNVETKAVSTPGLDTSGLDFSDDDVVGAFSALYSVNEHFNLLATYGTAFRAAKIIERLFNGPTPEGFGFQITNPSLESEESENFDVGFKYLTQNSYVEVVFYQNDIDNGVSIGANYTHIEGSRAGSATDPTGDTANDKYNANARWEQADGPWWVSYNFRSQPSQDAPIDSDTGLELPSFTVHRVAGGAASGRHRVMAAVDNVTDELYAEFSNASFFRPAPGQTVIVSYGVGFN